MRNHFTFTSQNRLIGWSLQGVKHMAMQIRDEKWYETKKFVKYPWLIWQYLLFCIHVHTMSSEESLKLFILFKDIQMVALHKFAAAFQKKVDFPTRIFMFSSVYDHVLNTNYWCNYLSIASINLNLDMKWSEVSSCGPSSSQLRIWWLKKWSSNCFFLRWNNKRIFSTLCFIWRSACVCMCYKLK